MSPVVLDANIIVRHILNDNQKLSYKAKKIIEENQLYLDEVIVAEVIWVLGSIYQRDNQWIATTLADFVSLSSVINPRKYLMLVVLELFKEHKSLSYIDCWIYALSQDLELPLKTQDKKLSKLLKKVSA